MAGTRQLAIAAVALAGCGDSLPPASAPPPAPEKPDRAELSCAASFTFPDDRYFRGAWRREALSAGPITLLWLRTHAERSFHRPRALYTKVLLEPHATTTVAVAPRDRAHVRLSTRPTGDEFAVAGGHAAVTFEGCDPRVDDTREDEEQGTGYAIAVHVHRPLCATFEITPRGGETVRRRVALGVRDCR